MGPVPSFKEGLVAFLAGAACGTVITSAIIVSYRWLVASVGSEGSMGFYDSAIEVWDKLATSENTSTIIVGLIASFVGAYGAQVSIMRRDRLKEVIKSINNANEAQILCFSICNTYLAMKKQHILDLIEKFQDTEKRHDTLLAAPRVPGEIPVFELHADLETLPVPYLPASTLEKVIVDKLEIGGKPLAVAMQLIHSIDACNTSIKGRNDIIDTWYKDGIKQEELIYKYLGVSRSGGTDGKYKSTLFAIGTQCDDCIFFSKLLCEELSKWAREGRQRYKRWHWLTRLPRVSSANFSSRDAKKYLPLDSDYEPWVSAFQVREPWSRRLWHKLRANLAPVSPLDPSDPRS